MAHAQQAPKVAVGLMLCAGWLACSNEPEPITLLEGRDESPPDWLQGRTFDIVLYDEDDPNPVRAVIGESGEVDNLLGALTNDGSTPLGVCPAELAGRFDPANGIGHDPSPPFLGSCGFEGAALQYNLLCSAHYLALLAETIVPVDIYALDDVNYVLVRSTASELPPGADLVMTVPPQDATGKATLALWATNMFQGAALVGTNAIDPTNCPDGTLLGTFPMERDAVGDWMPEPRAPLALTIMQMTAEGVDQMSRLAETASGHIMAAAQEKRSLIRDVSQGIRAEWRDRYDSRLEIANIYLGVPLRMFDHPAEGFSVMNVDGGTGSGSGGSSSMVEGEWLVVDTKPETPEEIRARGLVADTGVDPESATLGQDVRDKLEERFPAITDSLTGESLAGFLGELGVSEESLEVEADRLVIEARVRGRPIVEIPPESGSSRTVTGTSDVPHATQAAFLYANTIGAMALQNTQPEDIRPATDYLDPDSYGSASVYQTYDAVHMVIEHVLADVRDDLSVWATGGETYMESFETMMNLRNRIAGEVTYRIQTCVGQPSMGGVDGARIRLFGARNKTPMPYELWVGEAGLECATRGQIEGIACSADDHRVDVVGTVTDLSGAESIDAFESGLGAYYVEWEVAPGDLPGSPAFISEDTRLYIIYRRRGTGVAERVEAVGGTSFYPGTGSLGPMNEYSRCGNMPAGPAVDGTVDGVLGHAEDDASEGEDTCAGPRQRIPLEDEVSEAAEGRDDIESSFTHYLSLARAAADEADRLGEKLVDEGLNMDLRGEQALDELQAICGEIRNADELEFTVEALSGLTACTDDDDCNPSYRCMNDQCFPQDVTHFLAANPRLEGLRRCLGVGDPELTSVVLGSERICTYRGPDGFCDTVTLPCNAVGSCADNGATYASISMDPDYQIVDVEPLGLAEPSFGGGAVGNCELLLQMYAGVDPLPGQPRLYDQVTQQRWLNHDTFVALLQSVEVQEYPAYWNHIRFGNVSTGSMLTGLNTQWPCASRISAEQQDELCDVPFPPLSCGLDCSDAVARATSVFRLQSAIEAMSYVARTPIRRRLPETLAPSVLPTIAPIGSFLPLPHDDDSFCAYLGVSSGCLSDTSVRIYLSTTPEGSTQQFRCINSDFYFGGLPSGLRRDSGICPEGAFRMGEATTWYPPTAGEVGGAVLGAHLFEPGSAVHQALNHISLGFTPSNIQVLVGGEASSDHVAFRDAVELACVMNETGGGREPCGDFSEPVSIQSPEDIPLLAQRLQCLGDAVERMAARLMLHDIPVDLVDQLRQGAVEPSYPTYRGTYGSSVGELRAQLESIVIAINTVGGIVREFGQRIELAQSESRAIDLNREIDEWQLAGEIADQTARCVSAVSTVAGGAPWGIAGAAISAAAQCVASVVRTIAAVAIHDIRGAIQEETRRQTMIGLAMDFGSRADALAETQSNLISGYARVNSILADLDRQRSSARRALSRALVLEDPSAARELTVNRVMHARYNTTRYRYQRAWDNAIKMSWLARQAIEQRFGVDLMEMTERMALVEAPASWADRLCTMEGIDYTEIRDRLPPLPDGRSYDDRFIGDYVTNLELFVESYRIDHPFQDGQDVAVVSLRDDLMGTTVGRCSVEGWNLLQQSSSLEEWTVACDYDEMDPIRCPAVAQVPGESAFPSRDEDGSGLNLRARYFGGGGEVFDLSATCLDDDIDPVGDLETGECVLAEGGWMERELTLAAGEYIVSWYEPLAMSLASTVIAECVAACMSNPVCEDACEEEAAVNAACLAYSVTPATPSVLVSVFDDDSETEVTLTTPTMLATGDDAYLDGCNWRRVVARFELTDTIPARVRFAADIGSETTAIVTARLSSPQLEVVPSELVGMMSVPPSRYFATTDSTRAYVGRCDDTTGDAFRSTELWRRKCENLCPDGISGTCGSGVSTDSSLLRCFWETQFSITDDAIDRGEILATAGFAHGNYNYRFREFALNLVGSGVRDCSAASSPAACYGSGYLQYSLRHDPPYSVRNHLGEEYDAPLFIGNIEFAKALTAERYLTSPLSSADRGLLTDYWRREFRGRPLSGNYTLRVYDTPGLEWGRLEDIQLVIGYRYWTRFE